VKAALVLLLLALADLIYRRALRQPVRRGIVGDIEDWTGR
jgi:hypothetical protein